MTWFTSEMTCFQHLCPWQTTHLWDRKRRIDLACQIKCLTTLVVFSWNVFFAWIFGESESIWNLFRLIKWKRFHSKVYLSYSNVDRIILRVSQLGDYAIRMITLRLIFRLLLFLSPLVATFRGKKAKFCISNHVKDIFHWYFK